MKQVAEKIWISTFDLRLSPGVYFPTTMTVVDAGEGDLLLYSPIPIDDELEGSIRSVGEVRWIIAPNDFHHIYVEKAAKIFPEAAVYGAPGAVKKQAGVDFAGVLGESKPLDLPESVVLLGIDGAPALEETVMWLPDESAMVCCDLVFNMRDPKTWMTKLVLKMVTSGADRPEQSRSFKWFFVKDKSAYRESILELSTRRFDTLVMSHGEVVKQGGDGALRKALEWALPGEMARITA